MLTGEIRLKLQRLLAECFPTFLGTRTYFKQVPQSRLLAMVGDDVVGQVGVDYRMLRMDDRVLSTFGIVDLCLTQGLRRDGIATALLGSLEKIARTGSVDALIAFADDPRLYLASGFFQVDPKIRWLAVDDRRSVDVVEMRLGGFMMVKPVHNAVRVDTFQSSVDMLGHMY